MIKKILSLCLVLAMAFGVTACGESKQTSNGNSSTTTQKTRKFTEAKGMIKYLTIDGKKIPFPETVGEYVSYLEKVGDKIELGNTGKTVDEAIPELDKYLDDAYLAHLEKVRVVHGRGTGALRNGVHQHLRKLKYVKSFHLGEFGEGDSGVTIVTFK